jgi:ketosteroid isomerase-like protein
MEDVRQTLEALNRAWLEGRFDELKQFFDADVLMKGPSLTDVASGRDALVRSYADFVQTCKVMKFSESNHSVTQWGDVATASYDWSMTYEREGRISTDAGHELYVFARRGQQWVAVLRVMLF